MKRLTLVIILCIFTLMTLPPRVEAASSFSDTGSHWAKEYINTMADAGYISGYADGTFKPDKAVTRAEFTSVLIRCQGYQPITGSASFADIKNHWSKGYVNKAVALNMIITSEYGTNFGPDTSIKRSEICAMLARALGKQPDNGAMTFNDSTALSKSRYRGYIKVATDLGLLSGYPNGNFEPFQEVTRAQMCKVISNLFAVQGKTFTKADSTTDSTTTITTTSSGIVGDFSTMAIGDQVYDLATTPVAFKSGFTNINVTSMAIQEGYLFINGEYRFAVDSSLSDLDVIVNNTRYNINQITSSGNRLIILPGTRKLANVSISGHKYDSDYVNVYINSAKSSYYLSDLNVIDTSTVNLGGKDYSLNNTKITIDLSGTFYDITGFSLSSTGTIPSLEETDSIMASGYSISDISAIFVGTSTLKLSNIDELHFLINTKLYSLSDIDIDGASNFVVNDKSYPCSDVRMIVDSDQYDIDHVSILKNKLVFYCTTASDTDLVLINNKYRDASDVKIIKDGVAYDLDDIIVVRTDVLRIGGKQYTLDTTFLVSYDGNNYYMDRISYDSSLQLPVITTSDKTVTSSQPLKYKFYVDSSLYQDGVSDNVAIYTTSKWVTFSQIVVPDPSHFTVNGSSYQLIGAMIKIKTIQYKVTDTAWHGSTQVLDLYLTEL